MGGTLEPTRKLPLLLLLAAFFAAMLTGCDTTSVKLRVRTQPEPAFVQIWDAEGKLVKEKQSPFDYRANFTRNERYTFKASPLGADAELLLPTEMKLTAARYADLPPFNNERKSLIVKLDKKEYESLPFIEAALVDHTYVGYITQSRAFNRSLSTQMEHPTRISDIGDNMGIQGLALSPDDKEIVYSVAGFDSDLVDLTQSAQLVDGQRLIPLTGCAIKKIQVEAGARAVTSVTGGEYTDMFPCYSRNAAHLFYSSNQLRSDSMAIVKICADRNCGVTLIFEDRDDALAVKPTQGNNGVVSFAVYRRPSNPISRDPADLGSVLDPGDVHIWTQQTEGGYPSFLVKGTQPHISPDGAKIAYIGKNGDLWVINSDGSDARRLTFDAEEILADYVESLNDLERRIFNYAASRGVLIAQPYSFPSWSPDSKHIVYTSMAGTDSTGRRNEDIWTIDLTRATPRRQTSNGSVDRFPVMSRDGKSIYFLSNRGQGWAIWSIDAPN
jgi:WD40-like Beta Propeller Repeat